MRRSKSPSQHETGPMKNQTKVEPNQLMVRHPVLGDNSQARRAQVALAHWGAGLSLQLFACPEVSVRLSQRPQDR